MIAAWGDIGPPPSRPDLKLLGEGRWRFGPIRVTAVVWAVLDDQLSLAKLWPFTSGAVRYPAAENETMLLSQLPYVPLGDLRTVVSYPHRSGDIPDETLCAALESVALPRYTDRLDEVNDWANVLSPASNSASRSPGSC